MCGLGLIYLCVDEDKLLVICENYVEKNLFSSIKQFCPVTSIDFEKIESCQKMVDVRFDTMIARLKDEHDWKKFPVCILSLIDKAESGYVYCQWASINGEKGSLTSDFGRVNLVSIDQSLFDYVNERQSEQMAK